MAKIVLLFQSLKKYFLWRFFDEYWHFPNTPTVLELSSVNQGFRSFERALQPIKYPDNQYNKIMGFILQSLNSFELIYTRYLHLRKHLSQITFQERLWQKRNSEARSRKVHPDEKYTLAGLRVDVEGLFIFGAILVTRSLLLFKLYFPDQVVLHRGKDQYHSINNFYRWLSQEELSPLAQEFKNKNLLLFKWLYAVLREYRNEFVEHMDKPYQQGLNYQTHGPSFQLSSMKWGDITQDEKDRINSLEKLLVARGVTLPKARSERHFAQVLFDSILKVPDDLLDSALEIIEEIGVQSPEPQLLVNKVGEYLTASLTFLHDNLPQSELEKHRIPTMQNGK